MKSFYESLYSFLKITIALFGCWSLYAQIATLLELSFGTLKFFSFLPVLAVILFLVSKHIGNRPPNVHSPSSVSSHLSLQKGSSLSVSIHWLWYVIPFILGGLYQLGCSQWIFWLLSLVYLFGVSHTLSTKAVVDGTPDSGTSVELTVDHAISASEIVGLGLICVAVILVTLGTNRPDADNGFFLSVASAAIDHPEESLYGFDNLYRSGLPLVEQHLHLPQTYEYFVALLAALTNSSVHFLYYILLPPLWSLAGILIHWVILRRFMNARPALVGLAGLVVILCFWGDGHRTFGNFAFVRMFQGKAIYLMVALPMIFCSALEFRRVSSRRNWLFLMLHQCAAVGFTTNALVVAPLACALILLSGVKFSRKFWVRTVKGLFASCPLIPVGAGMMWKLQQYKACESIDPLLYGYKGILGDHRAVFVLVALLILPSLWAISKLQESKWLSGYVLLSSALLFCPATQQFFGLHLAAVFSWRMFWCWPIPLLLALLIGTLASRSFPHTLLSKSMAALMAIGFAIAGPWAVNTSNWSFHNMGEFKVLPCYKVALRIMSFSKPGDLVLAPGELAIHLCCFQNAPKLVAVRKLYLRKLRGEIPEEDWIVRDLLFSSVSGRGDVIPGVFIDEVKRLGIDTIAFRSNHPSGSRLKSFLSESHFKLTSYCGYTLAAKTICEK